MSSEVKTSRKIFVLQHTRSVCGLTLRYTQDRTYEDDLNHEHHAEKTRELFNEFKREKGQEKNGVDYFIDCYSMCRYSNLCYSPTEYG